MANRLFYQFLNSGNPNLTLIEGGFTIGASGAVTAGSVTGFGVESVTKLGAAGTYRIKLEDSYNRFLGAWFTAIAGVTGSDITAGSFVANTTYQITAVGNTDFVAIGATRNAVGVTFVATGVGSGTGTAKAVGIANSPVIQIADSSVQTAVQLNEGIIVQTLAATNATTTTLIPTNLPTGTMIDFAFLLRNSSILNKGES